MEKIVTMLQDELLYKKYSNIGVLHLPKCPRIEMLYKSPFATYEQRPYVCAAPTECFKVQISEIDNQSDYITSNPQAISMAISIAVKSLNTRHHDSMSVNFVRFVHTFPLPHNPT